MNVKVTVDRIEGEYVVLLIRTEEEGKVEWPVESLPGGVGEGDILEFKVDKNIEKKESAEERVGKLIEKLKDKN